MAAFRHLVIAASEGCSSWLHSSATGFTPITARFGHVPLGARGHGVVSRLQIQRPATTLRGVQSRSRLGMPVAGLVGLGVTPHSAVAIRTGVSRHCGVAQLNPEGSKVEVEVEGGSEEQVVEGCRVCHGELWNGDVRVHYIECGDKDGELVVLIHGFPNFWYVWKNQFQALAEAGYHVVAPDLRGYNSSSKPKSVQDYGRLSVVSDMVRLIDELGGGKRAILVGHDWGGLVTWAVAEEFPKKVKNVVVANVPHLSVLSAALRSSLRQIRRSSYIGLFQLPWLPEWIMIGRELGLCSFKNLKAVLRNASFQSVDVDRHVRAFQKGGAITGAINYYRAAVRGYWSPAPNAIPVEIPVDLIWGELDTFLGKELAVIPSTIASNVVIKYLPNCSHWPMWDDPKQFNALLLESFNSHHAISADEMPNNNPAAAIEGLVN